MTNDTKFGMVVGLALVITTAVLFFQKGDGGGAADPNRPPTMDAQASPPANAVTATSKR